MRLIYLGAEVPSNRVILEEAGATYMGVSYHRLVKRGLPKTKAYLLENYFNNATSIFVHAGVPKHAKMTQDELTAFAADYEEFIIENIHRITLFTEFDHPGLSTDFIQNQRKTVWAGMPPSKFLPVWQSATGLNGLKQLVNSYLDIGIRGEDIEEQTSLAGIVQSNIQQHGSRFHAIGCAKPDNLRSVKVETASSMAWLSPMMRGETIVWDGGKIVRYPSKMKEQARPRYKAVYDKAGLDYDKIIEDDAKEVSKLAIWSYDQLELRLMMTGNNGNISDMNEWDEVEQSGETTPAVSDRSGVPMRKVEPRNPDEMGNLPVFGYTLDTTISNEGVIEDVTTIHSQSSSLRQCNTCFVASNCPAYKVDSACAFKLPVEVKTKEQLKSLINAVIEMQGQRVAFMRFAEEINGGYADPNVSQEIDRLFKLIKVTKELDDSREFIRMTVERQGGAGVLSSIFGDKAQALRELPDGGLNEEQTTKIIKQATEE